MAAVGHWWPVYASGRSWPCVVAAKELDALASDGPDTLFQRFIGDFASLDAGPWDVPQRLKAPSLHTSYGMLLRHGLADWQNLSARLCAFMAIFLERLRRLDIPMYVSRAFDARAGFSDPARHGLSVTFHHGRFHDLLTPLELQYLCKVAASAAASVDCPVTVGSGLCYSLPLGASVAPPVGAPVRFTPRGYLRRLGS